MIINDSVKVCADGEKCVIFGHSNRPYYLVINIVNYNFDS